MQSDVGTAEDEPDPHRTPHGEVLAEGPSPRQGEQIVRLAASLLLIVPLLLEIPRHLQLLFTELEDVPWFLYALQSGIQFLRRYAVSCALVWFLVRGSTGARWIGVVLCGQLMLPNLLSLPALHALYMANEIDHSSSAVVLALLAELAAPLGYLLAALLLVFPASVEAFFASHRRV